MNVAESIPLLVIQGPTASGKTDWALRLAERFPLEVISADSRQVYRRLDIGTAKAGAQERARVPHHMLDLVDPDQSFSVAEFVALARPLAAEIYSRGRLPCVVGGTGLYIRALLGGLAPVPGADEQLRAALRQREEEGGSGTLHRALNAIDPAAAACIHPANLVKIIRALEVYHLSGRPMSELQRGHGFQDGGFSSLVLALHWERELLYNRINRRVGQMLEGGLVEETRELVADYGPGLKVLQTLGYREVLDLLAGRAELAETRTRIEVQTRRYAKRQLTWFRKEFHTIWVDSCEESGRVDQLIENLILQRRSG